MDLGCGTGELSAYLADLVGPDGNVVAADPDKERILLSQEIMTWSLANHHLSLWKEALQIS